MSLGKILIIEDDSILRNIYHIKLSHTLKAEVCLAVDGEEGIQKASDEKPTVILLDLILPKKNGFEVLSEIRNNPALKHLPVIVFSVLGEAEDRQKAMRMGADEYLIKHEISLNDLIDTLKKYLDE
ncbi:MAG TPA: response regulator [Patescibacteria group bacterium]|nr:response regulator [Patescibacteria group bacterium]